MSTLEKPSILENDRRMARTALLYLLPSIILFSVFVFYPMFRTIYLSFFLTDQTGNAALFVGFENYAYLLESSAFSKQYESNGLFVIIHSSHWHYPCRYFSPYLQMKN